MLNGSWGLATATAAETIFSLSLQCDKLYIEGLVMG